MTNPRPASSAETEPEPLMDRDELARLFTVTPGTIHRWDRDGMPRAVGGGSGRQAQYRPSSCVAWRQGQLEAKYAGLEGLNPQVERAKRDRSQARLADQLHRRRAGEVIEMTEVRYLVTSLVLAARARLLRLPSSMAATLAAVTTPAEVERLLTVEVRAALEELSRGAPPVPPVPDTPPPGIPALPKKGRKS
jgi:phage terminase Nu1 subunit (DNA packaging protein)